MELVKGRPDDTSGRQDREVRVYDFLDEHGIEFFRVDHPDQPAGSMEDCIRIDRPLGTRICKNLFLANRQLTQFYLLIMPGEKKFKTKELSSQINSARLSFGPDEYMLEYLDILPGAVSLMGLMNDHDNKVRLLVDEEVLEQEEFGCHPCVNTSSIKMRSEDAFGTFLRAAGHELTKVHLVGE